MPRPTNPPSTAAADLPYIFSLPKSLEWLLTAHWIHLHPLVWSIRSPNQSIYPWSPFRFSHLAIPPLSNYITLLITRAGQLGPPRPPGMHLSCAVFSPCHIRNLLSPSDIHPVGNICQDSAPLWNLTQHPPPQVQPRPQAPQHPRQGTRAHAGLMGRDCNPLENRAHDRPLWIPKESHSAWNLVSTASM